MIINTEDKIACMLNQLESITITYVAIVSENEVLRMDNKRLREENERLRKEYQKIKYPPIVRTFP